MGARLAGPGQVTGAEVCKLMGGNHTYAHRFAREAQMPPVGPGRYYLFTIGHALAIVAAPPGGAGAKMRRLLLAHLPTLLATERPQFVVVGPDSTVVPASTAEHAATCAGAWADLGGVVHVLDVRRAVASLEAHLGRSVGWAA